MMAGPRVLYIIVCAAPPAAQVTYLVGEARAAGWAVCVILTPSAVRFADPDGLARQTGFPVRSEYKNPGEPDVLPEPDAIIVAPATVNTINKWAAGICDTLALGLLVEAIGKRLPVVAVPWSNAAHRGHPVFAENLARLISWGVRIVPAGDPDPANPAIFPWWDAMAALTEQTG